MIIRDSSGSTPIAFRPPAIDAFGRQRVSDPVTLFDWQAQYDAGALLWDTSLTGGAAASHNAAKCAVDLSVTTASGDKAIRQTRAYHRYQPGKSQQIMITFVMSAGQANTVQSIGYYDDDNGVLFRLNGTTAEWVLRSNTSGSPVDTVVAQSAWNFDTFSDANFSKSQIAFIDLEWLGVGTVRVGFVIDGNIRYVHSFHNANVVDKVYMRTANLPVRYEIENTGVAGGAATLQAICSTVIAEGGFEEGRGLTFSASRGATLLGVTTRRPVLSIRPKATFNSIVNRGQITPQSIEVVTENNGAFFELVYGATSLTGASFASADANSIAEYDTAATAITGGTVISSWYSGASRNQSVGVSSKAFSRLPLTLDIAGANPKTLTLCATSLNLTADIGASLSWSEIR